MSSQPVRRYDRSSRASPREVVPVLERPMTKTLGRGDDSEFDILCEPCVTAEKGKIQQRMKRPMSESDNHMFVRGGLYDYASSRV